MDTNINLMIEDFKNNIIDTINNAGFPPSVVYYVLKDIFTDVEASYKNFIHQERIHQERIHQENTKEQSLDKEV